MQPYLFFHRKISFHLFLIAIALVLLTRVAPAQSQDSATYDPIRGTWQLYYQNPETDQWTQKTYIPSNQVTPDIRSEVSWRNGQFQYEYNIRNTQTAKQFIGSLEVWSLPLVIEPTTLPALTATHEQSELRGLQIDARYEARRAFEKSIVRSPAGWNGGLRLDKDAGKTSIVWNVGIRDTDSEGIKPGQRQSGFGITRPELPGVARFKVEGRNPEPWIPDQLPDTSFWNQKVQEIRSQDYILSSVIAPVIQVPAPYSGSELARRLKTHVNTWVKYGHVSQPMLDKINLQFDQLIPSLENRNKRQVRETFIHMLTAIFREHPGMHLGHSLEDEDKHNSKSFSRIAERGNLNSPNIDRLAARVLVYDLFYILVRMEMGH
jgi:hypothetical protein